MSLNRSVSECAGREKTISLPTYICGMSGLPDECRRPKSVTPPISGSGCRRTSGEEETPQSLQEAPPEADLKAEEARQARLKTAREVAVDISYKPFHSDGLEDEYVFRRILYNYRVAQCNHYIDICRGMVIKIDARKVGGRPFPGDAEARKEIMDILLHWQWELLAVNKAKPKPEQFRPKVEIREFEPISEVAQSELGVETQAHSDNLFDQFIPFDEPSQSGSHSETPSEKRGLWD